MDGQVRVIEPVVSGAALVKAIETAAPAPASAVLWRLGQAGMIVRLPGATIAIDPYLSNHCEAVLGAPFDHRRLTRAPLDPAEIGFLDAVLVSHAHLDHLDPPTIRSLGRTNPQATIIGPVDCRPTFAELDWPPDRIRTLTDGQRIDFDGWSVTGIAVPHESFDLAAGSNAYLGFIVEDQQIRFAHLGDSLAHQRVVAALTTHGRIDLLTAPINGRDEQRQQMGFAGNMTAEEAVQLAVDVGRPAVLPMHYDMFEQNVDRNALRRFLAAAAAAEVPVRVAEVGEALGWTSP